MLLIRKLHKWFGLVLGLQFLIWSLSGAVMALLDHHKVSGEHAILPVAQLTSGPVPAPLAAVQAAIGAPIVGLELKPLLDRWVYQAKTADGVVLLDAGAARPFEVDAAMARALATARYAGTAPIESVSFVEASTHETRDMARPVWRIGFADADHTALFVSRATGEVLGAKTDTWRLWDIAWMLHIMNYGDRQSFNHPLIVTVATGVAWLALSGLILLFRSFRGSDIAWITGPSARLGRRWKARERSQRPGFPPALELDRRHHQPAQDPSLPSQNERVQS
ncbi:PepSY domain-containing protein [Phenylobacterium sp. LH3H17]|uniref:PepSY domain-containing protein n=1 Tax=Phenylobacterium sp. LH3H17 TaxID=2903901 RepID=UPI0020C996FA|nr:PepSY domain-containing protein [Phenylobacterium sp. LH3H17]UTP38229.1 PepSY domain-containing protein [Phenylobacterium sp. LH3H17]